MYKLLIITTVCSPSGHVSVAQNIEGFETELEAKVAFDRLKLIREGLEKEKNLMSISIGSLF